MGIATFGIGFIALFGALRLTLGKFLNVGE